MRATLLVWAALVVLALRPVAAVDTLLAGILAPLRLLSELCVPLGWMRSPQINAAESRIETEAEEGFAARRELFAAMVRGAQPSPELAHGRRLISGAVLGRAPGNLDRLIVQTPPAAGVEEGQPVVVGDVFVGRVAAGGADAEGLASVDLVTGSRFHVGAVRPADGLLHEAVEMTVGGLSSVGGQSSQIARGGHREVWLALHNPSERRLASGAVRVRELSFAFGRESLGPGARFGALADGFHLGRLVLVEGQWRVEPALDYRDGLFQVTVLAPERAGAAPARPREVLTDGRWLATRALTHGDPSPWRSGLVIASGSLAGVRRGAAVVAGARILGRIAHVGLFEAHVQLLDDPGLELVTVARLEGLEGPAVLGRLVSVGSAGPPHRDLDSAEGAVLFEWQPSPALFAAAAGATRLGARIYTGAGERGLPPGLLVGDAILSLGGGSGGARVVRVEPGAPAPDLSTLWVRLEGPARGGAGGGS